MKQRLGNSKLKPGFTLLETLVAVVLISIGFLAAMMMQTRAIEGGSQADRRTVAVFLAESKIDQISALNTKADMPDELQSGQIQVEERLNRLGVQMPVGTNNETLYTRRTMVRYGCPTTQSNEVEVEVTWPGAVRPLTYVSVILPPAN